MKDTPTEKSAKAALATNATDIGTLLHQLNKYLAVTTVSNPATGLADELGVDNGLVTTFIDDQAAKNTAAVGDVVAAAEKMRHTAVVLAAASAKLVPAQFPGNPTGTAANLVASVTSALVEHVELAALTTAQLATGQTAGADQAALDTNTAAIDNIVIVNFGDQPARDFSSLWGGYVSSLQAYSKAKATGGTTPDLSGMGQSVGAFFAHQSPLFNATVIGSDMQQVVDGLEAAIDAAAGQGPAVASVRVAAGFVPKLASDVAEGIAELKPTVYLP